MLQENKISPRQLRRMLFIEMFGAGALSVPALACYQGQSGFWAVLFYGIFLIIITIYFSFLSEKMQDISLNIFSCRTIRLLYGIRFFLNAIGLFYFFGNTIQTVYMPESGFCFILFPAAVLLWYSLHTTLQKRARFLELIFPWIISIYLIAVILSFIGIRNAAHLDTVRGIWPGIFSGAPFQNVQNAYFLLLCSSPIEFLLFLKPALQEKKGTQILKPAVQEKAEAQKEKKKNLIYILATVGGVILCNVLFVFLSVRTLGQNLTSQSMWPVIKMMQLIRLPGGFLERFDILPITFWLLCMIAVLSGYLYYAGNAVEPLLENITGKKEYKRPMEKLTLKTICLTGAASILLLIFTCFVEKQPALWMLYLKYKTFVDFPLSLLLPLFIHLVSTRYKQKNKMITEKSMKYRKKKEGALEKDMKYRRMKKVMQKKNMQHTTKRSVYFFILVTILFTCSLTGCQTLTDVEEKNYILSMYIDYPTDNKTQNKTADKADVYEFWIAHADLSKMEEHDVEIPCQVTKINAHNLQELEEKYKKTVPGKAEWNHIYTIFLGTAIAADKTACTRLLKEWDDDWQKSPNVLLALCPQSPEKLYKMKNIPDGAAGQEAYLLIERNKQSDTSKSTKQICETPIDYLRATGE